MPGIPGIEPMPPMPIDRSPSKISLGLLPTPEVQSSSITIHSAS